MYFTQNLNSQPHGIIDYIPARLTEGSEWYISYYVVNPNSGRLARKKVKLNRIRSITERRKLARRLIIRINDKLSRGWNPFLEQTAPKAFHLFSDVLDTYSDIIKKEIEASSAKKYESMLNRLRFILKNLGFGNNMLVCEFTPALASEVMLRMKRDPNISHRTYNNYLLFFKTVFNWLKSFGYVSQNPFEVIKKMPKKLTRTSKKLFTPQMLAELREYLLEKNSRYYAMCLLCYYCFIRPNEIAHLKVSDFDLKNQTVKVRDENAKNDHTSYRTIPDVMMPHLLSLEWEGSADDYVFSGDLPGKFVIGKKNIRSHNVSKYWITIRKHLGWPKEVQFYNLKHTGITDMLGAGVAPNFVQGQADHHSLEMTSIYAATRTPKGHEDIRTMAPTF